VLMDILGYRYGAVYFAGRVMDNVTTVIIIRGLYAGMSQLADRIVSRVRERATAEHGGTAAWQDAANVSRQLTRLISVTSIVIAFVFLSQSWSTGAESVNVLKEWNVMTFADGPALTVFDLVAAAVSIASAHFLASNIAGLFELMVFPVFGTIHRGSRYVVLAMTRYVILTIGYAIALVMVHFSLASVGWLLTAASFGLGFGLQEIIANFVSGLMMMVEQPVRVGDVISVGNTSGTVERITIRATVVTNWDHQQILIPNKEFITKNLTNWTRNNPFTRRKIAIRVAFGSDVEKILKILEETVKGVENVRSYPPVRIWFSGVDEYTLDFMIWAYIDVDFGFSTQSAIRLAVHAALANEGVEIPLPQTDIHMKNGDNPADAAEFLGDTPPS
jgi:potassium efflux system protein